MSKENKIEETVRTPTALERVSAYASAVVDGDIVAGPHVRNTCRRHFDDLENAHERGIFFSEKAAAHAIRFFEKGLTLSDGQFEGRPFILAPMQCFVVGSLFGWKKIGEGDEENWAKRFNPDDLTVKPVRRYRRAFIEMGKGNGKSPLAGGIGLFGMTADGEKGAQIYAAAAKKEQAQILFQDAVKAVRRSKRLAPPTIEISGGIGREFNMMHKASGGSFFRPISKESGKSGSGPRPSMALCDEVHEHPDRAVMEMLERGFKARENPLLLMITNSGVDLNSVCWEEHVHAVRVAAGDKDMEQSEMDVAAYKGVPFDDTTFSYVCALDKGDDPLKDPSCWIKANPMLGIILKESYIAGVVKQAVDMPGKKNGILRLHFCVWTDSVDGWMAQEKVEECMAEFDPAEIHREARVAVGLDLSGTRDLTAMAFGTETGQKEVVRVNEETGEEERHTLPMYDIWLEAWTPKDTLQARVDSEKKPYDKWVEDGHIYAVAGERIRYDHVARRLQFALDTYNVLGLAYDNYAYSKFQEECDDMGLDFKAFSHPQGGKARAKLNEEEVEAAKLKGEKPPAGLWMPESIKIFEDAVLDGRVRIRSNPVVMAALMGATLSPADDLGNRWFIKRKSNARIDPAVAIAMCMGLLDRMRNKAQEEKFQLFFF